jgi:hypothetical protein
MDTTPTLSSTGWGSTQTLAPEQKRQKMSQYDLKDAPVARFNGMAKPHLYVGFTNGVQFIVDPDGFLKCNSSGQQKLLGKNVQKVLYSQGLLIVMGDVIQVFNFDGSLSSLDVPPKIFINEEFYDDQGVGSKTKLVPYKLSFRDMFFHEATGCLYALVNARLIKDDYLYLQKYHITDADSDPDTNLPQYQKIEINYTLEDDYNPNITNQFYVLDNMLFLSANWYALEFKAIQ